MYLPANSTSSGTQSKIVAVHAVYAASLPCVRQLLPLQLPCMHQLVPSRCDVQMPRCGIAAVLAGAHVETGGWQVRGCDRRGHSAG